MKFALKFMLFLLGGALILAVWGFAFLKFHPVFGGTPDEVSMAKIRASKAFDGSKFISPEPTKLQTGENMPSLLSWAIELLNPPASRVPSAPLPSIKPKFDELTDGDFVWLGHSSVLFRTGGITIAVDPVFGAASPVGFISKPFAYEHAASVSDLPRLDAVLISHDHYDHLDYKAITALGNNVGHYYVPLGVKAHLVRWGIEAKRVSELDVQQSTRLGKVELTLVAMRHFSGRTLGGRDNTLWGGWVIKSDEMTLLFGGDSGYGEHFRHIAAAHAPFDLVMLENGAYNENWSQIHMTPEQVAQVGEELLASALLPIHWAKFDLAYHDWDEPIKRLIQASNNKSYRLATPRINEIFRLENLPQSRWWSEAK